MSWMTQLYKTYDNLSGNKDVLRSCRMPLLPISHTIQNSHLEMLLDENSEIVRVDYVSPEEALTVVPCTEDSSSRANGIMPHALYDNLKYIAGDAYLYSGSEKMKDDYNAYLDQLAQWCADEECPEDVKIIYNYIEKGTMVEDLIKRNILVCEDGKLTKKWNGDTKNKPIDTFSTFVRFVVLHNDGTSKRCNENKEIIDAYSKFDGKKTRKQKFCFVNGKETSVTYKHPAKIRNGGDSAKLISANDSSGYTYRGRFKKPEDVFAVGYDVSQKAHNALRWLVSNQGYRTGDQTIIVWASDVKKIPSPMLDTDDIKFEDDEEDENQYTPLDLYADNIKKAVYGYGNADLKSSVDEDVMIMIIEAATPGRLSIVYYREMKWSQYLENIINWHQSCIWNHNYKIKKKTVDEEGKKSEKTEYIRFTGTPSLNDIIYAAYGMNVDEKLKKHLMEILVSCVAERKQIPKDIVMKAVERISNPQQLENWEIRKYTSITCALLRKYLSDNKKGEYYMALDLNNTDRSYLFGRVLAYMERIESFAQYKTMGKEDKRIPNAMKLRSKFRVQPKKTMMILDDKLAPYIQKLYLSGNWLNSEMNKVIDKINENDYMSNKPLEPQYILGYASQMTELTKKIEKEESEKSEGKDGE